MNRSWKRASDTPDGPDGNINEKICRKLRIQRLLKGLSQEQLAREIGISYQQLQKYEAAKSRLPCNLLYRAAVALGISPALFFADLPGADGSAAEPSAAAAEMSQSGPLDISTLRSTLSLQSIANPNLRRSLHLLIAELARSPDDPSVKPPQA